jgi:phospholipid/cholesterol/gamma-HCH transport system permease protein
MHLAAAVTDGRLALRLQGAWHALELPAIERELAQVRLDGVRAIEVDARGVDGLDVSGAWALSRFLTQARARQCRVSFAGQPPELVHLVETTLEHAPEGSRVVKALRPDTPVEAVGRRVVKRWRTVVDAFDFTGRLAVQALRAGASLRRLRPTSIVRHVYDTGITAIPIVSLIAFLISVIIAYMSAQRLLELGAEIYVVDLVTIGVLRELGVLLTAIIVAGRSGSAYAAEIGAMKLNEEVDALTATGVDPIEVLVLPRIIGLVIALPLLTVIADAIGLAGGALLCRWMLDMPIVQFLDRAQSAIAPTTFWAGIIKAPVFAILIGMAGAYRGLQVRGSSRELGRLTTVAVVQSIFLVILADALFAIFYMQIGF